MLLSLAVRDLVSTQCGPPAIGVVAAECAAQAVRRTSVASAAAGFEVLVEHLRHG